jgi:hypothetical protein
MSYDFEVQSSQAFKIALTTPDWKYFERTKGSNQWKITLKTP